MGVRIVACPVPSFQEHLASYFTRNMVVRVRCVTLGAECTQVQGQLKSQRSKNKNGAGFK